MIELFEFTQSGNSHKARLLLSMLKLDYKSHNLNGAEKEHKAEQFLALNPFGQVPVLKDRDIVIRDSQAILVYLARAYGEERWFPAEPAKAAQVTAWLSTAANEISHGPAALRAHFLMGRPVHLDEARAVTDNVLHIVEKSLQNKAWLAADSETIADIAVYPYLALAPQGKVDLAAYPEIRKWLHRVESLPGYVSMPGIVLQA